MTEATPHTVRDNIRTIIRLEEQQDNERSLGDRVGDTIGTFAGTITFVVLQRKIISGITSGAVK